jgi:hypothetical protein
MAIWPISTLVRGAFCCDVHGVTAVHLWATYPTAAHLLGVAVQQLADFLSGKSHHRLTHTACLQKAAHILHSLDDSPIREPDLLSQALAAVITDLAQRLPQLRSSIEAVEAQLRETLPATGQHLETLRGIGTVLAAVFVGKTRDIARFHCDKDRFASYNAALPPPAAPASMSVRCKTTGVVAGSSLPWTTWPTPLVARILCLPATTGLARTMVSPP